MGNASETFVAGVQSFIRSLQERVQTGRASELTLRAYEKALRRGAMTHFGSRLLSEIRTVDVIEMRDAIAGDCVLNTRNRRPGGPAAANMAVLVTRMVFAHAARTGMFDGPNPARDVPRLSVPNERNPITKDAGRKLADVCCETLLGRANLVSRNRTTGQILAAYFLQVMATGARRSEVARLQVRDFDLENRTLHIRRGKGGVGRTCILSPEATYLNETIRDCKWSPVWMFPSRRGDRHIKDPLKAWGRLCDSLKLPQYRIHDVRHGFAEAAHAACGDLKTVQKLMGHSSVATTSRYVGYVSREVQEPVVNAVTAQLMGSPFHRVKPEVASG